MLKVNVYSAKGVKLPDFTLPKEYESGVNLALLAQARRVYEDMSHIGLRKTKTRAEINRTGKKVYKQKGTGGARHGSRRAPIYVGGGIAHGPRPIRRLLSMPGKMKAKAKLSAISYKIVNKEIVIVDGIGKIKKTKDVSQAFEKLSKALNAKRFTLAYADINSGVRKFVRNLGNVDVFPYKNIDAWRIISGGVLVIDKDVFKK